MTDTVFLKLDLTGGNHKRRVHWEMYEKVARLSRQNQTIINKRKPFM